MLLSCPMVKIMGRWPESKWFSGVVAAAVLGLVGVTGCGAGPPAEEPEEITPSAEATEEIPINPYIIAQKPQQWVDWGSHVIAAEVVAEREIEPSYYLDADLQGREVDLALEEVLWSHPQAVTPVTVSQTVSLDVSPGWSNDNPAVQEGDTRMDVGDTYLLTLADSYDDGEQDLICLFGSVSEADVGTVATVKKELSELVSDPDRAPMAGEAWDARFMRTRGYERP